MNKKKAYQKSNNKHQKKNNKAIVFTSISIVAAIIAVGIILLTGNGGAQTASASSGAKGSENSIVIQKSDVTDTATFIPYQVGSTKMEVIAVKAPDGTIRTAFNTCQVCYNSGRGYYVQEGDVLVCQNCGNRFKISQVDKEKNGCNPVPILSSDKTEDDKTINISADFIAQYVGLFED